MENGKKRQKAMSGLAKARRAMGMSVDAAASIAGVSKMQYTKYEHTPGMMKVATFASLLAAMDDDCKPLMLSDLYLPVAD